MADDEDDYESMTFGDTGPSKETSLQKTARLKKEAAERGRIPSKAERAAKAKADRDAALATEIDKSNVGAKLMSKMGYKGGALGQSKDARTQPIEVLVKDDKGGIGMDSDKKRKVREAADAADEGEKRRKVGLDEFRERNRSEREEKRAEGLIWGAMKVLEGLEEGGEGKAAAAEDDGSAANSLQNDDRSGSRKRLRDVNVLYRPLLKQRLQKDRDRQMRYELNNSLSTRNDADSDDAKEGDFDARTAELDDEDAELDVFEALPAAERLANIIDELRVKYWYCFWCKYQYPDTGMEGCPGLSEDEHG